MSNKNVVVNAVDRFGVTPLAEAAKLATKDAQKSADIVALLKAKGAVAVGKRAGPALCAAA